MAKFGGKKKNKNVFKVAGSRTLKAKNKAKSVTTHLKQLNQATTTKTEEINIMLSQLQDPVRQNQPNLVKNNHDLLKKLTDKQNIVELFDKTKEESDLTVDQLNRVSF